MNKKNITPNPKQPVDRVSTGKLPNALAELSEDVLQAGDICPSFKIHQAERNPYFTAYDGGGE